MNAANDVTVNLITAIRFFCHVQLRIPLPRGAVWSHTGCGNSANTTHWTNVGLMLDRRQRRWANINPTLVQWFVIAGTFTKRSLCPTAHYFLSGKRAIGNFQLLFLIIWRGWYSNHVKSIDVEWCFFSSFFNIFEARHGHIKDRTTKISLNEKLFKKWAKHCFLSNEILPKLDIPIFSKTPTTFNSSTRILWSLQITGLLDVGCRLTVSSQRAKDICVHWCNGGPASKVLYRCFELAGLWCCYI